MASSISRSSSSEIGDYMGMENGCTDMEAIDELLFPAKKDDDNNGTVPEPKNLRLYNSKRHGKETVTREFPPPIPLLARTENLAAHMPWVLKRHYTADGRLVLHEVKVRHHEYFKAHRENGRLTLQLVPMDNDFISQFPSDYNANEGDEGDDNVYDQDDDDDDDQEAEDNEEVINEEKGGEDVKLLDDSMAKLVCSKSSDTSEGSGGDGGGVGGKCLNYDNSSDTTTTSSSSSKFGLPVLGMRPVHSKVFLSSALDC